MTKDMSPQEEKTEEDDRKDNAAVEDVELAETEDGSGDKQEENDDKRIHMKVAADAPWKDRMWEVFTTFWPLGFIAFGGPQAHVAILRDHLVIQRDWLDEEQFTELFAIGQVSAALVSV
jgi:chromate transporter